MCSKLAFYVIFEYIYWKPEKDFFLKNQSFLNRCFIDVFVIVNGLDVVFYS